MDESTRRLVAAEKNRELLNFHENLKSMRKLAASGNSDVDGTGKNWPHNLQKSNAYVPHLEKVFSNVRQRYGLSSGDKMENLDVNAAKWGMFMSVASSCNSSWERLSREFTFHQESDHAIIETVVSCNCESDHGSERITGIPVIDWQQQM